MKVPTEALEQIMLFKWAVDNLSTYPQLSAMFAIPNGGSRHPAEAVNLKRQGVKKGVPDIFLAYPVPPYNGMFIELKRLKGGVVSEDQKVWMELLHSFGYHVVVCKGFEVARDEIIRYFGGGKNECGTNPD